MRARFGDQTEYLNLGKMYWQWQGIALAAAMAATAAVIGCADEMAQENANQLKQEQSQIEDLQHQIDALKQQQGQFYALSSQVAPGGCDHGVMHDATKKGEDKLAAHDYEAALDYYQDAASACPNDASVEFNLARAYEAMGDRDQATVHYRRAAKLGKGKQAALRRQARQAISRIAAGH